MNTEYTHNLINDLIHRLYTPKRLQCSNYKELTSKIDDIYNSIASCISPLRVAIESKVWSRMEVAVGNLIVKLLDNQHPEMLYKITPIKRQEREIFAQLGGMNLLLKFLEPPLVQKDARSIPTSQIQRHVELWNEVLVMLREICFAVPNLSNTIFSNDHITFLFTMLAHDFVFENTMSLLEEILAVRTETYSLANIPDLYNLLGKFSTRRLAHFCRVLALLLFEPEDRQIMECSQVLRSFELLTLRRNRLTKSSFSDIERNQNLIIDMPQLLSRLVSLLRLSNYGPTLAHMLRHNHTVPAALSADFLLYVSANRTTNEWEHFQSLQSLADQREGGWQQRTAEQNEGVQDDMEAALVLMMRALRSGSYTPAQAASELEFQATALAPHQVELLFVMCTLLSSRRKLDVQKKFSSLGLAEVLRRMYSRLSWDEPPYEGPNPLEHIHGPSCECNPESALRVQYLRLVHNFYDRDFHNNESKCDLILPAEREVVLSHFPDISSTAKGLKALPERGLLRSISRTLSRETSNSIYRFWLSSCLEAYLRGASQENQVFVAASGVLEPLIDHICTPVAPDTEGGSGWGSTSLQTSFDLLGEIAKNNRYTVEAIERTLIEKDQVARFMDVMMGNLVDSNVFMRSLYKTLEGYSDRSGGAGEWADCSTTLSLPPSCPDGARGYGSMDTGLEYHPQQIDSSVATVGYLSHTWLQFSPEIISQEAKRVMSSHLGSRDGAAANTSTPNTDVESGYSGFRSLREALRNITSSLLVLNRDVFGERSETDMNSDEITQANIKCDGSSHGNNSQTCQLVSAVAMSAPDSVQADDGVESAEAAPKEDDEYTWKLPTSVHHISSFLEQHREKIVYGLMTAVTLQSVNHENICCINTALLILIYAKRRGNCHLERIIHGVKHLAIIKNKDPSSVAWMWANKATHKDISRVEETREAHSNIDSSVLVNFRELLWYWREYYMRRGRDRLSLEFSSHVPFRYWNEIVGILCRDDGSPASLLKNVIVLPDSPYSDSGCSIPVREY